MIEEGKTYKIKKIRGIDTKEDSYATVKKIVKHDNPQLDKIVFCNVDGEDYVFPIDALVDPEDPQEYSNLIAKIESVMKPMNLSFWKEFQEEATCSSLGTAPCPTMGAISGGGISAATVNGLPVPSKSTKGKKKKKNEELEISNIIKVTPEEMIEQVEETFGVNDTLQTTIKNGREIIRVSVFYTNPEDKALTHTLKLEFLDVDEETVIDEVIEEDLTLSDCKDELVYLFSTHEAIDGELYENIDSIVNELLDENFLEEYENITDVIAKELDRLNFEYANTDDIIYKKEGEFKYLIKFDNEVGILKFKVSKDQDVVFEKEFQIENEEDVNNAFQEIEDVYRSNGL